VAVFNWCICVCKDSCHMPTYGWPDLKGGDCHMAASS